MKNTKMEKQLEGKTFLEGCKILDLETWVFGGGQNGVFSFLWIEDGKRKYLVEFAVSASLKNREKKIFEMSLYGDIESEGKWSVEIL